MFSAWIQVTCYSVGMAEKPADRKAEATPKGIQKVNLSDLSDQLNKRGRDRYEDPELADAFRELLSDKEPFIWKSAVPEGKDEKALTSSKMKWRSRAVSVFNGIPESVRGNATISISWTKDNRMVIQHKVKA